MFLIRLLFLLLCVFAGPARGEDFAAIPPLTGRVVDSAGMLDAQQRASLENVLRERETRTGSQIAILLVSRTAPEAIEQYSIRVADAWKIGRQGIDDGVILVVAKDNPPALRRLRIEAGRGVQGVLTDAQSKRILQDVIAPHFRQNDFYGGLSAGIAAIGNLLDQEKFAPPERRSAPAPQAEDNFSLGDIVPMVMFLVFAAAFFGGRLNRRRGVLGSNDWGGTAGILIGNAIANSMANRGGWSGGGGSWGGSGGGFSGGGGSFDGGGASGDW